MTATTTAHPHPRTTGRALLCLFGFALLMAWRQELTGLAPRAALAGAAAVFLVCARNAWRTTPSRKK